MVYWTDWELSTVNRAFLDGSGVEVLFRDLQNPEGLTLDIENRVMYWTDSGSDLIERATLDGRERSVVLNLRNASLGAVQPSGIVVDPANSHLYWTDRGTVPMIERSGTDGSGRRVLIDTSLRHPYGIALDLEGGRLYWCDAGFDRIEYSDLLGQGLTVLDERTSGLDLFVYYDFIYWTDVASSTIQRVEASGRLLGNHGSESFSTPLGIHIFKDTRNLCASDPCWNGGSCVASSTGFTCICAPQFIGQFCESQSHPHDLVFVTDLIPPGIYVAPTDTFNFTLIPGLVGSHDNISQPAAIDYDPKERMVYWTDWELSTLNRAFLDGSGVEVLFRDLQNPWGLTLDIENRVMYWTDGGSDLIERATLDGRERSVVLGAVQPSGIVVDPANSHLYWTDRGTVPMIERSGTDGSGRRVLIDTSLLYPYGIALDLEGGRLYWCDSGLDRIEYSDLLGQGRTVLDERTSPLHLFVYYDFIYWTDAASSTIKRVEASGRLLGNHGSESFTMPLGIHIFRDNEPPVFSGCPGDVVIPVKSSSNQVAYSWPSPLISDNAGVRFSCQATKVLKCNQTGSGVFTVGVTTVIYNATDISGNHTTCVFKVTVTVVDLMCPANFTVDAQPGSTNTSVDWMEPVLTGWDGPTNFTSSFSPGDELQIGSNVVNYQQWFEYGLVLDCSFSVQVIDTRNLCASDPCWNGGSCVASSTGFTCICAPQFIGQFCESQSHPHDLVFVTDLISPGIYVAPTDTFNFTLIPGLDGSHDNINLPAAIDYDPVERMVYWTDYGSGLSTINRAFLDGSGVEVLFRDLQTPEGLTLDIENRVMYWTDFGSDLIERATLDGVERSVVLNLASASLGAVQPIGIVVDPANSHLYWTGWGTVPMIERSGTDGSGRRVLIDTSLLYPYGIALDLEGGRLYWCDYGLDRIEYSDLLGQGRTVLDERTDPLHLFVYYDFIYWTDAASSTIKRVEASGRLLGNHGSESFTMPLGIHIFRDNEPPVFSGCPGDVVIPVKPSSNQVAYSWPPPLISDSAGPVDVTFSCQAIKVLKCNRTGSGVFTVGVTTVIYNATDISGNHTTCLFKVTVTVVDLMCPANFTVDAEPGSTNTSVDWMEPVLTGWDGPTNFTSSFSPGDELEIGSNVVNYRQQFEYGLILDCSFSVQVIGSCPASITNDALHGRLMWLATRRGTTAESFERCLLMTSKAGQPLAVRNCSVAAPPFYFQWGNHVPRSCGEERNEVTLDEVIVVNVSMGNVNEVVEFLANQTSESSESAENVEAVSTILMNIVGAGSGDAEVTELVIQTVSNVIMSTSQTPDSQTPEVNAGSSSAIVQSVEAQVSLTLRQEGHFSVQQDTIHVEAVSLDPVQASNGLTFVSAPQQQTGQSSPQDGSLAGTKVTTTVNASEVPHDVIASIRLPANIVDLLQAGNENGSQPLRASFIVYADDTLFKSALIKGSPGKNGSSLRVAGSVVSLTVEDVELVNLTEPVVIQFKAPAINEAERNRTTIQCVFWDFDLNDRVGDWSMAGCLLATESDNTVSCNCSHATNFAILVNFKGQGEQNGFQDALDIISQVGCVISIIALGITLTVYLAIKKLRTGKSRQIFIHLFFSWLMLYIVFLAGVDNARGTGGGCVFVTALLHYFALSTMMWTAVEARNMYVSTVKVFPEDTPHYMLKACLIAWGSPLIVLTITLAAATDHYRNEDYCFLKPGLVLYLGLLAPIGLILIHNIITFILVMRSLLKVNEASRSQQISKRLQNAVGISTLMGLTWCFGFLAIEEAEEAFQLIFCLANSFQGLIVFILFCVRREEVRTALAPYMKRLCCGRTCDVQVPWKKNRSYDLPMSESVPSSPSTAHTAELDMSVSGPY
ncbi:uncharacterized protein LOC119724542 [Patiria miniata]|uniref:Uncharacterized protein n=1 Tax=Patiria miniata TaxID=46514 RepID=A0A913ZKF2_PATMI|nr:uncharacterized protein LOC119724542 [Patiria miniata]